MITKDEFEKAVECCAGDNIDCDDCPLCASDKHRMCSAYLAEYITKNEPAPAVTGTSSEVSVKENTDNIRLDEEQICQAYETAGKACADMLDIYEGMSECEKRAFDIGEVYGKICSTRDKLEKMRGGKSD